MNVEPKKVWGLTANDPKIFHFLEKRDLDGFKGVIHRHPACIMDRMESHQDTPLIVAAWLGLIEYCEILLRAGAQIDAVNRANQTALLKAVTAGEEALVDKLLASGANANIVAQGGDSPLHIAAQKCTPKMTEALIRAGADLEAKRFNESTPAIMACFSGRTDSIKLLASHGADIVGARCGSEANTLFTYCLMIAAEFGHAELLDHLLEAYSWSAKIMNGALKEAATMGYLPIVQTLVKSGADPFAPSGANNKTAFERAKQRKNKEVVEYLKTLKR